jgi:hypothetical protein
MSRDDAMSRDISRKMLETVYMACFNGYEGINHHT